MTGTAQQRQRRFSLTAGLSLSLLAMIMAVLWYLASPGAMTVQERALWDKVRAAQLHMTRWRESEGVMTPAEDDPWSCGLIGVEWSGITTTLGELASKRTGCNPAWAVQFLRWFDELDLKAGDRIAIYSSGSFPGLALNALVAAETMELDPLLIVSLGASTWGANHPDLPWPVLAAELRRNGFIWKRADFYTLGAGAELGHGLTPEGAALLRESATRADVGLLSAGDLEAMITLKTELLMAHQSRLLISIGGSQANLGDAPEVLKLAPGLVLPAEADQAGNGVIATALHAGVPVLHMLSMKRLGRMMGIAYDSTPRPVAPGGTGILWPVAGLFIFFAVLMRHRRWKLEDAES